MLAEISIRKMTEREVEEVFRISQQSNLAYWSRLDYELERLRDDSFCIVAQNNLNEVVGFTIMRLIRQENYSEIYNIAVIEKSQRYGIAGMLLEECFKASKINGLIKVFLEVRASNRAAFNLYQKHGFIETGKRKNFYSNPKEDAISMCKVLI